MSQTGDAGAGAVVFLSGDLMFASRIRAAATEADFEFRIAGQLPAEAERIRWVIVDLATRAGVVDGLMDQCASLCPDAKVIAFGPHVQVAKLERAKEAKIPVVMTRGQFDRSLASLFRDR